MQGQLIRLQHPIHKVEGKITLQGKCQESKRRK